MTAYVTVMSELAFLVRQYFGSHHAYSSRAIPFTWHFMLGVGLDSDMNAKDSHMFCKFYFAALWDSLDVPAPCDSSSAIKPKVSAVLAMEARDGLYTPDKAERLIPGSDHFFEIMMATRHLPGIAGDASGQSSNTQCASRQLWKKYGVPQFVRPGG